MGRGGYARSRRPFRKSRESSHLGRGVCLIDPAVLLRIGNCVKYKFQSRGGNTVHSAGCGVWSRRTRVRGRGCYCTDTRRKKTAHICDLVCALELNHERSAPPHSTLRASLRLNTQLSSSLAAKRFFRSRSFFFSPSTSAILLPVQRGEKSLSETSHGCACACNLRAVRRSEKSGVRSCLYVR